MAYTVEQVTNLLNSIIAPQVESAPVVESIPAHVFDPIAEKIKKETDERVAEKMAIIQKKVEEISLINATFQVILEDYLGEPTSELVVRLLDKCRRNSTMNFNEFCAAYTFPGIKGDLHKRNLLIVTSALYRLKVKDLDVTAKGTLRSVVKYTSMCDECGSLAKKLVDRLDIQGIKFS